MASLVPIILFLLLLAVWPEAALWVAGLAILGCLGSIGS